MQQIADWLEKLGMSEYAQRFAENDIDIEVLGELTDTDFDRLGVSIGHRRKTVESSRCGHTGGGRCSSDIRHRRGFDARAKPDR